MRRSFSFLFLMLLAACAPAASPTQIPTAAPTSTATLVPPTMTRTPYPTRTPRPTKIPKASPTLPENEALACIPEDAERTSVIVAGVIDGDTIIVSINGLTETVRYLGIDTPEIHEPIERFGYEATQHNRDLLGTRVTLIRDPNDEDRDIYNRLLRHVVSDGVFVNYQMVRDGFSFLFLSGHSCAESFFEAYTLAQQEKLGLFAPTPAP